MPANRTRRTLVSAQQAGQRDVLLTQDVYTAFLPAWHGWCESPMKWMMNRSMRALSSWDALSDIIVFTAMLMALPTDETLLTCDSGEYIGSRTYGRLMKCCSGEKRAWRGNCNSPHRK